MTIVRRVPTLPADALLARGVHAGDEAPVPAPERERLRVAGFTAKPGQVALATDEGGGTVALVGLGDRERLERATVRRAGGALVRATSRVPRVATTLVEDVGPTVPAAEAAAAVAAGALAASYRFTAHQRAAEPAGPEELLVVADDHGEIDEAVRRAVAVAGGVALARDLVNEPGGTLTPVEFARRIETLAGGSTRVVVHDERAIAQLGLGGLLGVNRGSEQPARFVEVHHEPAGAPDRRLALVGKGITFDSGGINLKQKASALLTMKSDMGGAAAVVATMLVLAELEVPVRVSAYLPLTDNMTGGDATRPGDVLRMVDGTTVEVVDTDAEGRLVLADALAYAVREGSPDAVVDIATLTGTQIHVTGTEVAVLVGTDDRLLSAVRAASARSGERVWEMPRVPEYRALLRSTVADMTNRSEAPASTAFAALFLESFVGDVPWAHVDMAACALRDRDTDDGPAGARGWGVELLVELADAFGRHGLDP